MKAPREYEFDDSFFLSIASLVEGYIRLTQPDDRPSTRLSVEYAMYANHQDMVSVQQALATFGRSGLNVGGQSISLPKLCWHTPQYH